jgi:phosphoribosylformylglycinamidine synthase
MSATMTLNFKKEGDVIVLIGAQQNDIGSSEYLHNLKKVEYSPSPHFDFVAPRAHTALYT